MTWKQICRSSAVLMILAVVVKVFGMLREVVLAGCFGTSYISDAYLIAASVPVLLFAFIGQALSTVFLPMYNKEKVNNGKEAADRYANNLLCISMLLATVLVIALVMFPGFFVKVFAIGFEQQASALAQKFIRSSAASLYFMVIISVWSGYLQTHENYVIPAAIAFPRNIIIIISVIAAASIDISLLGYGMLAAYVGEFLFLLPAIMRTGYRLTPRVDFSDDRIKESLYLVLPILLGMCVSQINKIVDRSMASTFPEGGVSALTYASVLNNAVQEVIVTALITVLFAKCSAWVAQGLYDKVQKRLTRTIEAMILVLIPATFGIICLARPIVTVLLGRGQFDRQSIELTAGALVFYTAGLFFLAVRDIFVKVFYAYEKTKITTFFALVAIAINIGLNLILPRYFGLDGLALATCMSAVFNCISLYIAYNCKIERLCTGHFCRCMIVCLISAIGMTVCVNYAQRVLTLCCAVEAVKLVICVCVGALAYLIILFVLGGRWVRDLLWRLRHED